MEPITYALKSTQNHPIVDNNEPPLNCEKCQFETKCVSLLTEHMQEKHRIYACEFCKFSSSSEKGLNIHNTKSHPQYEYTCTLCDYCTYKWGDFQKHKEIVHELSYSQSFWIFCKYCGTNYKHMREN